MTDEHLEWLQKHCWLVTPCGSRVTCDPAPMDTDEDWLVQLPDDISDPEGATRTEVLRGLHDRGFRLEGNEDYLDEEGMEFQSWRREEVNLIVTYSQKFVTLHELATNVCQRLNLMSKADRIMLFEAILYQTDARTSERRNRHRRMDKERRIRRDNALQDPPLPQDQKEPIF
jgi:hypothetical protein